MNNGAPDQQISEEAFDGIESEVAVRVLDAPKPDYWFQGFGNDWLEHFYELDSIAEKLPLDWKAYIPSQWGVLVLLVLLVLLLLRIYSLRRLRQQLNAYRLEATQTLAEISNDLEKGRLESTRELPLLFKRCLLVFSERSYLSGLTESEQLEYMNSLLPQKKRAAELVLGDQDLPLLEQLRYQNDLEGICPLQLENLIFRFGYWLRWHEPGGGHVTV